MDDATKQVLQEASDEIEEIRQLLLQKSFEKGAKNLLESINKSFIKKLDTLTVGLAETIKALMAIAEKGHISKQEILGAISNLKLEPKINITTPPINIPPIPKIEFPEIKIPEIKIPQIKIPKIEMPEIKVPEIKIPKEINVTGFASFAKALLAVFKGRLNVVLGDVNRNNPLPVILTDDEGTFYRAVLQAISGGGARIVEVRRGAGSAIHTIVMTNKDTSYSLELPTNTVMYDIKLRTQGASLKYSWSDFGSFMTIPAGGSRHIENIKIDKAKTIYFQSPTASQTAEVEVWTQ